MMFVDAKIVHHRFFRICLKKAYDNARRKERVF